MDIADLDLAAVASPGQTVFLRSRVPVTVERHRQIVATLDAAARHSGIIVVLLDDRLEVARIADEEQG